MRSGIVAGSWCIVLFMLMIAPAGAGTAADEAADAIAAGFVPEKATVRVMYDVSYRFLGLQLFRVATAELTTTEGRWRDQASGAWIPACLMDFRFRSKDDPADDDRDRISLHNRIRTVLTMPELDTILCVKETDEHLNPLFKRPRRNLFTEVYDLRTGSLAYNRADGLTGAVVTNLAGTARLAEQGREVSNVLKIMSSVYYGREEMLSPASDFRIHVNIDGEVKPFSVVTRTEAAPDSQLGRDIPALCVEVVPPRNTPTARHVALWATSFRDVATQVGDASLVAVSEESPPWSMVPLVADYALALGSIRCSIRELHASAPPES